jgi:hypothetical protein
MTKLKRQRARKKFNYQTNRRRVRDKLQKNTKFNVKVDCPILKESWDNRKSVRTNMTTLGVAIDANAAVTKIKPTKNKFIATDIEAEPTISSEVKPTVSKMETEAAVVKAPTFRFSGEQVKWISGMMDKHKYNFKAMSRDPKNHYQETPKQIEHKVRKFMKIPDHYVPYCRERGLLESSTEPTATDMET